MAEEKSELDLFLENKKKKELQKEMLSEPGRDLSAKFVKCGLYKAIGKLDGKRWTFETDKEGIVVVDKKQKVEVSDLEGNRKQQVTVLPLEKILSYNSAAIRGKGGITNPAFVLARA